MKAPESRTVNKPEKTNEYIPRDGEFDPLEGDPETTTSSSTMHSEPGSPSKPKIRLYSIGELQRHEPPEGACLVGDWHLQRGGLSVLAGPGGIGKSRATMALAIMAARGEGEWLGLKVHGKFRTLILQSENGLNRLHSDFDGVELTDELEASIRVSVFPPFEGFDFKDAGFRAEVASLIEEFKPDLIIMDPWNEITSDSTEREYLEALNQVKLVLASAGNAACLIIHHLGKPRSDDKHRGRELGNLLAGSYVLQSKPRCVMILQSASADTEEDKVVFTPVKNNDGQLGARSCWRRLKMGFERVDDFDWEAYDSGEHEGRKASVTEEHIREVFEGGRLALSQKEALVKLQDVAGVGRTTAYNHLKIEGGPFSHMLVHDASTKQLRLASRHVELDVSDAEDF